MIKIYDHKGNIRFGYEQNYQGSLKEIIHDGNVRLHIHQEINELLRLQYLDCIQGKCLLLTQFVDPYVLVSDRNVYL